MKIFTLRSRIFALVLLPLFSFVSLVSASPILQGGPSRPPKDSCARDFPMPSEGGGANRFHVVSGNVHREINDLEVWGGVGEHQLLWKRFSNSRVPSPSNVFGTAGNFRHSYQWEMVDTVFVGFQLVLSYPDGTINTFNRVSSTEWRSTPAITDILFQDGNNYTLQRQNGWRYRFERIVTPMLAYYQLQDFTDSQGNVYHLAYDSLRRLIRVTEPAGRFLQINWQTLSVFTTDFVTLATITDLPSTGQFSELPVSNSSSFQFLRYFGLSGTYCTVAEVQFFSGASGIPLTGTRFGTGPASPGQEFDKATDGDTATFFSDSHLSGGFTGINLGAGNAKAINKVRYFPRTGYESFMLLGELQGANTVSSNISVISQVTTSDGRSVTYHYQPIDDLTLPNRYQALTSVVYGDSTQATYSYVQVFPSTRPLLMTAIDPRHPGQAVNMKYEYDDFQYTTLGTIRKEINGVDGEVIAELDGANAFFDPEVINGNGAIHDYVFNSSQLATQKDGLGRQMEFTYDQGGNGFLISSKDARGNIYQFTNTTFGNWLSKSYPDGTAESWTRDTLDLPLTHTDQLGRITRWTRDSLHRATRIDYADGAFETFTYNSFGQVVVHRLKNSFSESNVYDARGLRTSFTDATGKVTQYTYDAADRPASVTDARGNITRYEYNERGLMAKIINADGTFRTMSYDAFGNKIREANELGNSWVSTYDEFRRLTSATDPLNRTTFYDYGIGLDHCSSCHNQDKPTQITLPSGKKIFMTYDPEWQITGRTEGFGTADSATTAFAHDLSGNLVSTVDPLGKFWVQVYDSRNRRIGLFDSLGNRTDWTYDAVGNVLTVKRPDGGITQNVYDLRNRLIQTTDPKNQITNMGYDLEGNLIRVEDAKANVYTFFYDALNRKLLMKYPDNSQELFTYDEVSNLKTYTARAGQARTYFYDNRNREIQSIWSDGTPTINRAYDIAGRLLTVNNSVSSLSYAYDAANQSLSETQLVAGVPGGARLVRYAYDLDGNRSSLTYPDGTVVAYTYTGRNQVASIDVDGPPSLATYVYDRSGNRIVKALENGTSVSQAYDGSNRRILVDQKKAGVSFARFDYGYDSVDRRKFVKRDNIKGDVFSYDAIDQVIGVQYDANNPDSTPSGAVRTVSYGLDPLGNRTTVTDNGLPTSYTANNLNQYTFIGGGALTYDANGNLKTQAGWTYVYDAQNRLTSAAKGGIAVAFAYDARNRCVKRTINGVSTFFFFDEWSLIEEWNVSGVETARYIHGAVADEILARVTPTEALYYHHDSIGNVTHLTDMAGNVVEKYTYDIFGAVTIRNAAGVVLPSSSVGNRFLFTGREWISEIGLYDYRNRFYSQEFGRFLQTDPLRLDGENYNLYQYVENNPVNLVDPSGQIRIIGEEKGFSTPNNPLDQTYHLRWTISYKKQILEDALTDTTPSDAFRESKRIGFATDGRVRPGDAEDFVFMKCQDGLWEPNGWEVKTTVIALSEVSKEELKLREGLRRLGRIPKGVDLQQGARISSILYTMLAPAEYQRKLYAR